MINSVTNLLTTAFGDCNNLIFQGYLVYKHQISKTEHDDLVRAYFNGQLPPPKEYLATDFDLLVDCAVKFIKFEYPDAYPSEDNSDIKVHIPVQHDVVGKYSISLFRGIVGLFEPDAFHFSKAKDGNIFKLAFYASKNGVPVYYGDLNDLYP